MIAVDTDILVHAHRDDSPSHERARAALESLADGPREWAVPRSCAHGFLAIVTHPRIYRTPTPRRRRSRDCVRCRRCPTWRSSPRPTSTRSTSSRWRWVPGCGGPRRAHRGDPPRARRGRAVVGRSRRHVRPMSSLRARSTCSSTAAVRPRSPGRPGAACRVRRARRRCRPVRGHALGRDPGGAAPAMARRPTRSPARREARSACNARRRDLVSTPPPAARSPGARPRAASVRAVPGGAVRRPSVAVPRSGARSPRPRRQPRPAGP